MIEPAVAELLGLRSEDEYPFPVAALDAPRRIYCIDDEPSVTPGIAYTLARGLVTGITTTQGTTATMAAARISISNTSARPMKVSLTIQAYLTISTQGVPDFLAGLAQASVVEHGIGLTAPSVVYFEGRFDQMQATPALSIEYMMPGSANGSTTNPIIATRMPKRQGILPPLEPGRAYTVEPNVSHSTEWWAGVPGNIGTANNGMFFFLEAWGDDSYGD